METLSAAPLKPVRKAPLPPIHHHSSVKCIMMEERLASGLDPWEDIISGRASKDPKPKKKVPPPRPPPPKIPLKQKNMKSSSFSNGSVLDSKSKKQLQTKKSTKYDFIAYVKPSSAETCLIDLDESLPCHPAGSSDGMSLNSFDSESNASHQSSSAFEDSFDPFGPIDVERNNCCKICDRVLDMCSCQNGVNSNIVKHAVQANWTANFTSNNNDKNIATSVSGPQIVQNSTFYTKDNNIKINTTRATIIRPKPSATTTGTSSSVSHSVSLPMNLANILPSSDPNPLAPPLPPRPIDEFKDCPYAVALFQFDGTEQGDLNLMEGEKVQLLYEVDDEWLFGRCGLKEGIFPKSFVEIKNPLKTVGNEHKASCVALNEAIALYNFNAELPDDLTIYEGDKITVLGYLNDEWLYGKCRGSSGQFPANFINKIPSNLPIYKPDN